MATRPQGTKYFKISASTLIFTGIGNLYSLFLNWRGVTAGDRVTITDGNGGAAIEEVILNNANSDGITVPLPAVGKEFANGIYVAIAITGGEMNVSGGYDGNG